MPGFPQTSSEARKAYTETMPQQSSKGIANPLHVMCPHHIHQLERAALKGVDKIYISLDLTWNYLNLRRGINPPYPNLVVTYKQSTTHMTYLIPAEAFFSVFLVFQYFIL